jgi:hypothetical protein
LIAYLSPYDVVSTHKKRKEKWLDLTVLANSRGLQSISRAFLSRWHGRSSSTLHLCQPRTSAGHPRALPVVGHLLLEPSRTSKGVAKLLILQVANYVGNCFSRKLAFQGNMLKGSCLKRVHVPRAALAVACPRCSKGVVGRNAHMTQCTIYLCLLAASFAIEPTDWKMSLCITMVTYIYDSSLSYLLCVTR